MRRTNKIILMSLLISLLLLGIGYAAIQNITLSISGFAEVGAKAENFNVRFLETVDITKNGFDNVIVDAQKTSDVTATINLSGLSKAGETITALYTVKNESPDLSADLTVSTTNDAPEYLTISSQLDKTSLLAGEETTVEVVVEVTKTPISENIRAQIGVELIAMPVQPGEEGTSEGIKDFDQTPNSDERNEFGFYYDRFYYNEEAEWGIILHADASAEGFELMRASEHPGFLKDEWICVTHDEPGEMTPEELLMAGAMVTNEGKTIIDPQGTEYILSDLIPHGIHIGNRYVGKLQENNFEEIRYLENGDVKIMIYDTEGNIGLDGMLYSHLKLRANGYKILCLGEIIGYLNVTGDMFYDPVGSYVFNLNQIHNYETQTIKDVTCNSDGEVVYSCSDCDESYTIISKQHNHKNDQDMNSICDDCGEIIEYKEVGLDRQMLAVGFNDVYSEITEINIPEYYYYNLGRDWYKIISLKEDVFLNCSNVENIVLPESITTIRKNVFSNCSSLQTVNFTGTQEQWEQIVIEEGNEMLNNVTINFNYGK